MEHKESKISMRRIFRLYVFAFLGVATLLLPANMSGALGTYAGIAILIGGIFAEAYLCVLARCRKKLNTDLFTFFSNRLPCPAGVLLSVAAALFHMICAGFLSAVISDMVKENLIREESFTLIALLLLVTAAYAAQKKAKDGARVCEILFWFVLAPLVVMLLFAAKDIDVSYYMAQNMPETGTFAAVSYAVFCCFGSAFFVLYFPTGSSGTDETLIRCVRRALILSVVFLAVIFYVLLGSFGGKALSVLAYPVITLMSMVRISGGFLKRLDAVMLAVWFFSVFELLCMHLYAARRMLTEKSTAACKNRLLCGCMYVLVFGAALLVGRGEKIRQLFVLFFLYVLMPLQLVLPVVLVMFGGKKRSGKSKKRAGNHTLCCLAAVLFLQAAGGCASAELEEKVFPLFAAVSSDGDSYAISYEPYAAEKKLDASHLKVIALSEELLADEAAYGAFLSGVLSADTYPRNAYVVVAEDISLLRSLCRETDAKLGEYLEEFLETKAKEREVTLPTIGALSDEFLNRQKTLCLPYLAVDEDAVSWENEYLITESVPSGVNSAENASRLQRQIASKILRFHVLANSDSDEDQAVKLKVRDAIGTQIAALLSEADSLSDCKKIVSDNLAEICRIAEETLHDEGVSYGTTGEVCTVDFPEKSYGAYTFPAGEYEALRIVLGDGAGQNWWCVLYPNLCFRGSVYDVSKEEDAALKSVLSAEEYKSVFKKGRFRIRLKLRKK